MTLEHVIALAATVAEYATQAIAIGAIIGGWLVICLAVVLSHPEPRP